MTRRLAQWMLLLQEFEFDIHHRPCVLHAVADYLNRLKSREPTKSIYDNLLDADIFGIAPTLLNPESEDRWINEMVYFVSTSLPPE